MPTHDSDDDRWTRAPNSPDTGQTSLGDNSETTVFDVGSNTDAIGRKLESMVLTVATGGHTNVSVAVKAEVNGSLTEINAYSASDETFDLFDKLAVTRLAARHIRVTATGDTASPGAAGTVDHTAEYSTAV